jgi:hypothetical protein
MSTTDLGVVEALLERLLPDPRGFADRVLHEIVERLTSELPGRDEAAADQPAAVPAHDSVAVDLLSDRNVLLAAAVGACECWGEDPDCPICSGRGSAGWTVPDVRLYQDYVEPAIQRSADGPDSAGSTSPERSPMEGVAG